MDAIRDGWRQLDAASPILAKLIVVLALLVAAVAAQRIIIRILRRAYWRRLDLAAAAQGVDRLGRVKRQKTLVTLLESLVRYGIYGAAAVAMVNVIRPGASSAIFSATLLGVLIGFGFQRLLSDVVAGALLLFEGHFAVGDVITSHGPDVTGVVEEFTLRTTRLRTLGGDAVTVLNGSLSTVTRWSYGQREFRIDVAVRGEQGAQAVLAVVAREAQDPDALWTRPLVVEQLGDGAPDAERDGDVRRLRLRAVVSPEHGALVEHLAASIASEAGADLVGPPLVLAVELGAFRAWQAGLLVRD